MWQLYFGYLQEHWQAAVDRQVEWHILCWLEKERQDGRSLLQTGACTQWSTCQISRCWCGGMTCNNLLGHTETDWRNHFYNQRQCCFFLEMLKYSQSVWYYGLTISSMSMGSLKNGAEKKRAIWQQPESCRQTHKWRMMIINTPIRHLLWFQACLESNVFTIKRRAQMSKEAHIIPLNGQRSTGRRTRVRRVRPVACDCFASGGSVELVISD